MTTISPPRDLVASELMRDDAGPVGVRYGVPLVAVAAALAIPFLASSYYLSIVLLGAIYALPVLGLYFITGLAGQLSLAEGAFFGIGAYTAAILSIRFGVPFPLTVAAAALAGVAVGLILGIPTLKLTGHYLALATIGFAVIVQIVLTEWTRVTGGADGIGGIAPASVGPFELSHDFYYYYIVLAFLAPMAYVGWRVKRSRIGRAFLAIREDELAASATGIDIMRYKILAFTLSTTFGAVGGALYAHGLTRYISPDYFNFELSVAMLTMLLLGGQTAVPGAILGAVLVSALPETLRFIDRWYLAVYGAVVVLLVGFMPDGLWGRVESLVALRRVRRSRQAEPALPDGAAQGAGTEKDADV
jgi:branched-chain amino acid transport system permease protein